MSTTELEKLVLGSLNLNDGVNFELTALTFGVAQKKPQFVTNADADGEALVKESHYTPASFDLMVRVVPQSTADAGRAKLGELMDAVQACEKVEGGQAMPWTPNNSETTYTAYVLTGDATELPIEVTGDNAGWLLKGAWSPVVKIHLTCRPFLYTAERTVLSATESGAEPLQVVYVKGIKGDVPADARLIVTDKATQDRRFAMWGRDVVTSESNPALLLSAKSGLTGSGFSGEAKTRSGAYLEEKVLRGTAVSQATTLCGTGRISNVGTYAVYVRVYATSEAARFRISYRNGDGPLIPLEWKQPPVVNGWSELYVGNVSLDAVQLGAQTSEIRVQQRAIEGGPANDVNYLELWPTKASGKARGVAVLSPTTLIGYDKFEQSAGNLESKAPNYPTSVTWGMVNKTGENGLKVNAADYAERAKVSDASLDSGCFAFLGTSKYADVTVSALVESNEYASGKMRQGLLARALASEAEKNCLYAVVEHELDSESHLRNYLRVVKRVAGTSTVLGSVPIGGTSTAEGLLSSGNPFRIVLSVSSLGTWRAMVYTRGTRGISVRSGTGPTLSLLSAELSGQDSVLAAGGTLAEGKVGLYDAWTSANACIRYFDNFEVVGTESLARACYSGKTLEFNPSGALRQDSTGAYDGPPSSYRGSGFYLEPEGKLGLINRVAMRMRRNDNEVEEDAMVTDKQSVEVKVAERYLLPR